MHARTGGARRREGKIDLKILIGCAAGALFLLLLACAGAGGAGYWWYYQKEEEKKAKAAERQRILEALRPELPAYLEPKNRTIGKGKFSGKVVCIDLNGKKIDEESLDNLPDSLRATKPDEVGAIALLLWSEEEVGNYPDGSKAKAYVAQVTLISKRDSKVLLAGKPIRGDILETKHGSGDRTGPKPWDKIVELLKEYQEGG
jgi:hypothetical protein